MTDQWDPSLSSQPRERRSHIFDRQAHDWYVEPEWCSLRLFETEPFTGGVWDPACGGGNIVKSARAKMLDGCGSDIVVRSKLYSQQNEVDFLSASLRESRAHNIVCNPPFDLFREFTEKAVRLVQDAAAKYDSPGKVAMLWATRRLPAARWLRDLPLRRVYLLTPRPSMPTGEHIKAGGKIGGGKQDFCWLVFCGEGTGKPTIGWLHREGK